MRGLSSVFLQADFPFPIEKGKYGCKDRQGRGSRCISALQCKDREFPQNFDVVPNLNSVCRKCFQNVVVTQGLSSWNIKKSGLYLSASVQILAFC